MIKTLKFNLYLIIVFSSIVFASQIENTSFDVNEIISKIMYRPLRAGSRFIIHGQAYIIDFTENGFLLNAVNSEVDNGKDILIPGKPEIKGKRIIYQNQEDETIFQGFIPKESKTNSTLQDYLTKIPDLSNNKPDPGVETDFFSTGEFLVDTSIVMVPASGRQADPAVAFDGTNFLVVWEDRNYYSDIYGARVSQTGVILDAVAIPISVFQGYQVSPSVAFDGTNFLVVWQDLRRGLYADIYGARITPNGEVLDPIGIPISTALNDQWFPKVAFDGTNYLVVWEDYRNYFKFDIYGTRVSPAGAVLDPSGIAISTAGYSEYVPCLTFGGNNYLVSWTARKTSSNTDIVGTRINISGVVLDPTPITISDAAGYQYATNVTFDNTNYFAVWEDYGTGDTANIYGARVNQAGSVLDPTGIAISTAGNDQWTPCVIFDGTNYFVVWEDYRNGSSSDIYGARVNQSGTVLDPSGIAICSAIDYQYPSVVSSNGIDCFVFWQDFRTSPGSDIYLARVNQSGTVLDPNGIIVSYAANDQSFSAVASDGTNYLLVWQDRRSSDYSDIFGALVNQSGSVITPVIAISTAPNDQKSPDVVFDGTNYFVVWEDYRTNDTADIYSARVNQSGVVLDPNGIIITSAQYDQITPCVAFDGDNYFVVWADYRSGKEGKANIYGSLVTPAGLVLNPSGIQLPRLSNKCYNPSVVFGSTNYLVVWQDDFEEYGFDNIFAVRVNKFGTVLDSEDIVIADTIRKQYSPSVCFDGSYYFAIWTDDRNGVFSNSDIYGTLIMQDGYVLNKNGFPITTATHSQFSPCIVFDGSNYLVVWEDFRNDNYSDIYGAKVNNSGSIISLFPITVRTGRQVQPALAHGSGNHVLITYSGWTSNIQGKLYNSVRIWCKYYTGLEEFPNFGWSRKADVIATYRPVKDGGCLTPMGDKIYALVGNNTRDFVVYDINTNIWTKISEVPFSSITGKTKTVKKGACICNDGYYIYVIKGNNTQEFYRYDPYLNTWQELPEPGFYKRIKGGSMAFDGERKIYLICGRKKEWKVFDIYTETWSMPYPETLPGRRWKYGSFILYIDDVIYGLCGYSKTNEFYKLDIRAPVWTRLQDMPLYNSYGRKKKAKKGACGTYDGKFIYALKGGNTYDFYSYDIEKDSWSQREDIGQPVGIPRRKVKGGGALTYSPITGGLFASVGNRTNEFWFYLPNPGFGTYRKPDEGKMAKPHRLNNFDLQVLPNPSKNITKVYYSLPVKISASVKIYSVTGKLVLQAEKDNEIFTINTKLFSAGVYMLKFEAGDYKATKKLLVAH